MRGRSVSATWFSSLVRPPVPRSPFLDGDAYVQMTGAIQTIAAALKEANAELRHVVRTVVYIVDWWKQITSPVLTGRRSVTRGSPARWCRLPHSRPPPLWSRWK